MRFAFHSPLKYLYTITPEKSGRRLTALAEGKPGVDWQLGEVYDGQKPMPVKLDDREGRIARELWERSEDMLSRT